LVKRHRWAVEPCFGFGLRPEDLDRAAEDFGKLPRPSALLEAQWLIERIFAALVCSKTDAYGLLQAAVVGGAKKGDIAHQVLECVGRQPPPKQVMSFQAIADRAMQGTPTTEQRNRPANLNVFRSVV